jgi:hypothetical protein
MNSIKGWKLREFKKSKSLTISQFSNELNYNPAFFILMYEEGIKRPDNSFWEKLNNTYNISPDYFMQ